MGYNIVEESLGALKKINNSGEVESLGNVWYTDRPFNVFPTRMLSIEGDLHLCAGYGNLDELLRVQLAGESAGQWGTYRLWQDAALCASDIPAERAEYLRRVGGSSQKSVNATLSFREERRHDNRPASVSCVDGWCDGDRNGGHRFQRCEQSIPVKRLPAHREGDIADIASISSGAFTGITRGVLGSDIENQVSDESGILYLDNLIQTEGLGSPYKKITLQSDTNRIFQCQLEILGVSRRYGMKRVSIARYRERPYYALDLGLTRHEKAWIEEIFSELPRRFVGTTTNCEHPGGSRLFLTAWSNCPVFLQELDLWDADREYQVREKHHAY